MDEKQLKAVMDACAAKFDKSGLSLDELGLRMGYPKESARKSAWQFLKKSADPRISMLLKFAAALQIHPRELFGK